MPRRACNVPHSSRHIRPKQTGATQYFEQQQFKLLGLSSNT